MSRSYLFVPADSERKLARAADAGADALILDLEDSVAAAARPKARQLARDYLAGKDEVWVRINPIDSDDAVADLAGVMPSAPAGIVLPKPRSAADAVQLAGMLDELEQEHGIEAGSTGILPICTERPESLFTLGGYAGATPRLRGLTWGAEDLSAALGASDSHDHAGNWLPPYALARSMCLFAAAAARVPAIDTVFTEYRNDDGLASFVLNARRDGFTGMLAIHPAQIKTINLAFAPKAWEVERAQRIVSLFAENPDAGVLGMDGEMLDKPHLVQAERILALADKHSS
jgi:citrate lyase subunit beta/citryl-CoA lyase